MKRNIYFDVDGVLLTKEGQLSVGADDFLRSFIDDANNTCYWLTTRCKGDPQPVLNTLQPLLDHESAQLIESVKATDWRTLKTEAIDFDEPFIWFDDSPFQAEIKELSKNRAEKSLALINLSKFNNSILAAASEYLT